MSFAHPKAGTQSATASARNRGREGMASDAAKGESSAGKEAGEQEFVTVDLPAPKGWTKKYIPRKSGTPRRSEVFFISPTGEEIKNKRQLDQYLRSHPGGPPSSAFDWGTGDTPRRSARISEKAKATETPESEPPKKRERKPSSKKEAKTKKDTEDGEDAGPEEEGADADVEMKETKGSVNKAKEEALVDKAGEEAPKTVEQVLEDKTEDHAEGETKEEAANNKEEKTTGDEPATKEEEEKAENEKPRDDSEVRPPTDEHKEKKILADSEIKDGEAVPENGSQKDEAPKSVPSLNCDDGQRQPEAAPVNC